MKLPKSAGGFPSILYTLKKGLESGSFIKMWNRLRSSNACKTCALGMGGQRGGMVNEEGSFPEVCKKSVQAVVSDMGKTISDEFWFTNTNLQIRSMDSRSLEKLGRIGSPIHSGPLDGHYIPKDSGFLLDRIAKKLKETDPSKTFFYFSGRSSNEAAFLLQLFARCYGTNNINNCSYYCHQASGVGLKNVIGSGTATLTLEDVNGCDMIFIIGGNPASNHPRFMTTLMKLKRRGCKVVVINPIKEVGLVNFKVPSDIRSLLFGTKIADYYIQPKIGGDIALLVGIAKVIISNGWHDTDFLNNYCIGFDSWSRQVFETSWKTIIEKSGVSKETIESIADVYSKSKRTVFSWTMGITHHIHGVENVETIASLALLRGMVGKKGAGLLPLRGHSNVQGVGSVGATPVLNKKTLYTLENIFNMRFPESKGLDTMSCMELAAQGEIDFAMCLGGNLFGSNPDAAFASKSLGNIDLLAYISTTLNTGHFCGMGKETIVFPVLARDEEKQPTTQESMFNLVRLSDGGISGEENLMSEVDFIVSLAERVFENSSIDWSIYRDHKEIQKIISKCIPGYKKIENIIEKKEEFVVENRIFNKPFFNTESKKATFPVISIPSQNSDLKLMTIRSEGQFNTVVYEEEDFYRGQSHRNIIMLNKEDIEKNDLSIGEMVVVKSSTGTMVGVEVRPFDISKGSAAMYYPESNVLVPKLLDSRSKTPAFKCIPIKIEKIKN